jgi:Uma2 family endonuclease
MPTASKLLTYEEWLQMPTVEDGTDEVVKGEFRFMPPAHYPHAEIIDELTAQFIVQVDRKKIRVLGSNFGLMISREPLTCRSPDLALYWKERDRIEDGLHYAAPDLIIEVLSPSENRRRKEEKMEDYASIEVPEVWIVSPQAESVEVRLLNAGKLTRSAILVEGLLQPVRFPGIGIQVETIWPDQAGK